MKQRRLLFLSLILVALSSCGKKESQNEPSYGEITKDTKFVLNASNVGSYFDIDISEGNNYVDGYVFHYRVYVSTKSRYKTSGSVSLGFRIGFKYTYKSGNTVRTQTSTGRGTINIPGSQISASGNYSVSVVTHLSTITSMSYSGYFESASGNLVRY